MCIPVIFDEALKYQKEASRECLQTLLAKVVSLINDHSTQILYSTPLNMKPYMILTSVHAVNKGEKEHGQKLTRI